MNRKLDEADVVVIGGGVVGMATAFYTSIRGKDVVLVGQKESPGGRRPGATADGPGQEARREAPWR